VPPYHALEPQPKINFVFFFFQTQVNSDSIDNANDGLISRIDNPKKWNTVDQTITGSFFGFEYEALDTPQEESGRWNRLSNSNTGAPDPFIAVELDKPRLQRAFRLIEAESDAEVNIESYLTQLSRWGERLMQKNYEKAKWILKQDFSSVCGLWLGGCSSVGDFVAKAQKLDEHKGDDLLLRFILTNFTKISGVFLAVVDGLHRVVGILQHLHSRHDGLISDATFHHETKFAIQQVPSDNQGLLFSLASLPATHT